MYKYLLRKKIKNIVRQLKREKAYLNLDEIKSILVLFDTENFKDASDFIQQMKKMDKKVKAIAFKNKKDANSYSNISFIVVTDKDMKGNSLSRIINILSDESFDLIVDLSLKENLVLLYILVSINATLKVGFYKYVLPVHDFVISSAPGITPTVQELSSQLIHYLTTIASGTRDGK